jgi:hypothetical protein
VAQRATGKKKQAPGEERIGIDYSTLKKPEPWDIEEAAAAVKELMDRPRIQEWLREMAKR